MALNRNYLGHDREFRDAPGNSTTFTTDPFTVPDDGSLLVVFVAAMTHDLSGDFTSEVTVSDSQGLTWTQVAAAAGTAAYARYVTAFVADGADAGNITVSVNTGSRDMRAYFVWVFSYTGHDPSDPVGAVGSAAPSWSSGSSPANVTLDLSSAPDVSSEVLVTKHTDIGVDVTQDHLVGTEIYDDGSSNSGYGSVSVLVQTGSTNQSGLGWTVTPNSTPPAWATGSVIAGVEILAAATLAPPGNVQAVAQSPTSILVTWDAVAEADAYDVERDSVIVAEKISQTQFLDQGLQAATQYTYRVRSAAETT